MSPSAPRIALVVAAILVASAAARADGGRAQADGFSLVMPPGFVEVAGPMNGVAIADELSGLRVEAKRVPRRGDACARVPSLLHGVIVSRVEPSSGPECLVYGDRTAGGMFAARLRDVGSATYVVMCTAEGAAVFRCATVLDGLVVDAAAPPPRAGTSAAGVDPADPPLADDVVDPADALPVTEAPSAAPPKGPLIDPADAPARTTGISPRINRADYSVEVLPGFVEEPTELKDAVVLVDAARGARLEVRRVLASGATRCRDVVAALGLDAQSLRIDPLPTGGCAIAGDVGPRAWLLGHVETHGPLTYVLTCTVEAARIAACARSFGGFRVTRPTSIVEAGVATPLPQGWARVDGALLPPRAGVPQDGVQLVGPPAPANFLPRVVVRVQKDAAAAKKAVASCKGPTNAPDAGVGGVRTKATACAVALPDDDPNVQLRRWTVARGGVAFDVTCASTAGDDRACREVVDGVAPAAP